MIEKITKFTKRLKLRALSNYYFKRVNELVILEDEYKKRQLQMDVARNAMDGGNKGIEDFVTLLLTKDDIKIADIEKLTYRRRTASLYGKEFDEKHAAFIDLRMSCETRDNILFTLFALTFKDHVFDLSSVKIDTEMSFRNKEQEIYRLVVSQIADKLNDEYDIILKPKEPK